MFHNKVVIITGSTQGIGLTTAEMLARRGARLIINSRSPQKVEKAVASLKEITPEVIGIAGDVSNFEFCQEMRQLAIGHFGQVDILINNAGIASGGAISDMSPQHFEKVVDINLMGSIYPTLACIHDIKTQKGSILFLCSVAGVVGLPAYSSYCSTKRALVGLAESLKNELADDGVFVGINYPGFTENESHKVILNAQGEENILPRRTNVPVLTREQTCGRIIRQLEKRKFRMYSSLAAEAVQWCYRFFPGLTLKFIWFYRHKLREEL